MARARGRQDGFALLIVLWVLALTSLLMIAAVASARRQAGVAVNLRAAAALDGRAQGVVYEAIFRLSATGRRAWTADGVPHRIALPGGVAELWMQDLAGRINPNVAPAGVLAALLREVGAPAAQADAVADGIDAWRRHPVPGAVSAEYRAAGHPYGAPGTQFTSTEELGLVLGMTPALLAAIAPHVTFYGDGIMDRGQSDPVVRAAMHDAVGTWQDASAPETDQPRVIAIRVAAAGPDGVRAECSAVVRISGAGEPQPWTVLAWNPPEAGLR